MRAVLAVLLMSLMALGAVAQFQPLEGPDTTGLVERTDLADAGSLEGAQRVLRFVQVSDAHILDDDAPYPLRQEVLDDYITFFSTSAQRPHEEYTDEVLDAIVRQINAIHSEDALDFVINTGDNIDNELENELMRFLDNWEGTTTTVGPFSQMTCLPDGQSTDVDDTAHDVTDACTSLPEALAANNTHLATGLPWFSAFGNHDGLIQGNVPDEPRFDDIAAESGRYFLDQPEYVAMHFLAGTQCLDGTPAGDTRDDFGHGYGFAQARLCDDDPDNDGYYAFSLRGVRVLVLDTVNDDFVTGNDNLQGMLNPQTTVGNDVIGGYAEGSIDPAQYAWMLGEIDAHADQLVLVMSHHTINSMFTDPAAQACCGPGGESLEDLLTAAGYKTGKEVQAALLERPNVVAWIGGHTHKHHIEAKTADGAAGGFWNIESSSLIDLPQEARVIELWETPDGKGFLTTRDFGHDFDLSRTLAEADTQQDAETQAGLPEDQEVLLWFDVPSGVSLVPQPSLPRALVLRMAEPVLHNGTHASVGENLTVRLDVTDNLFREPVAGLQVLATVTHGVDGLDVSEMPVDGPMTAVAPGQYAVTFPVTSDHTHYVHFSVHDPTGVYPDATRSESLLIAVEPKPVEKDSPGLPVGLVLAMLAALALVRRQNR